MAETPKKRGRPKKAVVPKKNTNVNSKRGPNNKAWWPTQKELDFIYEKISEGVFVKDIIGEIGVCSRTFYIKMNSTDPRMLDALGNNKLRAIVEEARQASCDPLISMVYKKAMDKNDKDQMRALIWYLEQIGGVGKPDRVEVNVETQQPIDITPQQVSDILKQLKRGNTYEHDPD